MTVITKSCSFSSERKSANHDSQLSPKVTQWLAATFGILGTLVLYALLADIFLH